MWRVDMCGYIVEYGVEKRVQDQPPPDSQNWQKSSLTLDPVLHVPAACPSCTSFGRCPRCECRRRCPVTTSSGARTGLLSHSPMPLPHPQPVAASAGLAPRDAGLPTFPYAPQPCLASRAGGVALLWGSSARGASFSQHLAAKDTRRETASLFRSGRVAPFCPRMSLTRSSHKSAHP